MTASPRTRRVSEMHSVPEYEKRPPHAFFATWNRRYEISLVRRRNEQTRPCLENKQTSEYNLYLTKKESTKVTKVMNEASLLRSEVSDARVVKNVVSTLMMKAIFCSETLVTTRRTVWVPGLERRGLDFQSPSTIGCSSSGPKK